MRAAVEIDMETAGAAGRADTLDALLSASETPDEAGSETPQMPIRQAKNDAYM